jgi:hypothetical protein
MNPVGKGDHPYADEDVGDFSSRKRGNDLTLDEKIQHPLEKRQEGNPENEHQDFGRQA